MEKPMFPFSEHERLEMFLNTANKLKIQPAMVEKDFWVYAVLDRIFGDEELARVLCFKGGTSLSKAFHLIERFSEDIDLILARHLILQNGENLKQNSRTKQDKLTKEINARTENYIKTELKDKIASVLSGLLKVYTDEEYTRIEPDYDPRNPRKTNDSKLHIIYPRSIADEYLRPDILLEIGPLALWNPNERYKISSYVADTYPHLGINPAVVPTIKPERTFWEKVTILHYENTRPENKPLKSRYSRHYYDIFKIGHSAVKNVALANLDLLAEIIDFDSHLYRLSWADYENAKIGALHLMPAKHNFGALEKDYAQMQKMFFNPEATPRWEDILAYLQELENEINTAHY
ncbi:MAG: nucleotidyl transferase AbiEii/AbiGii toxin family protein [Candidatus Margulisbacteria bacterium]|nr:nucleotidyl transferase AbiEii/AbiGii toxin family protein [Candidatus Margulisiibacteriota bacterium]